MSETRDYAKDLAQHVFAGAKAELRDVWDKLSEADRNLVMRCSRRAAELQLARLTGFGINERDAAHVEAQLLSIASAGEARVRNAVFKVLRAAFQQVVSILV